MGGGGAVRGGWWGSAGSSCGLLLAAGVDSEAVEPPLTMVGMGGGGSAGSV